jgi:SP family general alpha glucoside:H+ symporter-like MFS transporter
MADVPHEAAGTNEPHPSELLEFTTVHSLAEIPSLRSGQTSLSTEKPQTHYIEDALHSRRGTLHTSDGLQSSDDSLPRLHDLVTESKAAVDAERKLTLWSALKLYPKAIAWSALLSLTLVMEGYDLSIINGFFALPQFQRAYGEQLSSGQYQISTAWQTALTNGAVAGEVLGLFANGLLTERLGYRKTFMLALACLSVCIFLAFFAFQKGMLLASEILCGLSWGVFQTISTTYAAEVMPVTLRAYLTANVNLCWLIGQFLASGILRGTIQWSNEWSYRVPFGLQWMWSIPILIGVFFAPESPWWFVRNGRHEDAKRSLLRLTSRKQGLNIDETIAMMEYTNRLEKEISAGTSYLDCFRGTARRRTEIACVVWMIQTLSGGAMTGYSTYYFEQAGVESFKAFDLTIGLYGMGILGHVLSLCLIRYSGRRKIYMWGTGLSCIILLVGGIVGSLREGPGTSWTLACLVVLLTFVYDATIGPICYSLVAEIPSTRVRVKTVVLARVAYNIVSIVSNILMPQMLNPAAWDWKGKTCFLWAGTCFCCLVWCYFRLPEPKGLTYMELDVLFEKKASARKFRKFQVNLAQTGYFSLKEPEKEGRWHGYG